MTAVPSDAPVRLCVLLALVASCAELPDHVRDASDAVRHPPNLTAFAGMTLLEAEDARVFGPVEPSRRHLRMSGGRYLDFTSEDDGAAEFDLRAETAGEYSFSFRYALAAPDRTMTMTVVQNEIVLDTQTLTFTRVGDIGWAGWGELDTAPVVVPSGAFVVRLEVISNSGPNLDLLAFTRADVVAELSVDEASVDFGEIDVGTQARRTITVRNLGGVAGTIERASLAVLGSAFDVLTDLPVTVAADGGTATIELVFDANSAGPYTNTLTLHPGDGIAPIDLQLNGAGRTNLSELSCSTNSVDFGQLERGQFADAEIVCTAMGDVHFLGASVQLHPSIFQQIQPPSLRTIQSGDTITFGIEAHAVGLVNDYSTHLTIRWDGGAGFTRTHVALVVSVVAPPPTVTAMTIQQTWDADDTDVDLHLVRPDAAYYSIPGDCHWRNRSPEWGDAADPTDNPYLDVDDTNGFGPEIITLEHTEQGRYLVYSHYYSDHRNGPTNVAIEIHVGGEYVATVRRLLTSGDVWLVGAIDWDGRSGTFDPLDTIEPRTAASPTAARTSPAPPQK